MFETQAVAAVLSRMYLQLGLIRALVSRAVTAPLYHWSTCCVLKFNWSGRMGSHCCAASGVEELLLCCRDFGFAAKFAPPDERAAALN